MCQSHQRAANQVLVFHMGQCKGRHCIRVYSLISHGYYPRISRQLPVVSHTDKDAASGSVPSLQRDSAQ